MTPSEISLARAFDFDDFGAEIGKVTGAERRCKGVLQCDDLDAFQRVLSVNGHFLDVS